ncbi:MAG: glycosyltransferase family 4 protein [Pseudomonadota bacterium]
MESSALVLPSVLFVSKPVAPPFHDGTKCLVRDIATHLTRVRATVLSTPSAPALGASSRIQMARVYSNAGAFAPGLSENLRAALWVLARSRADVWHFVFAPNRRTSGVGRWLGRIRRRPIVQTIASPPRSFDDPRKLLFGEVVVAQSRWTRAAIEAAYAANGDAPPRLEVIPPPVTPVIERSVACQKRARAELEIPENARVFVYPGDLETSRGAEVSAAIAGRLGSAVPDALVVFAYRRKTARAPEVAERLAARLDPARVRFACEVPDVLALIASAEAVIFPVDDLFGKVDVPIVLLESMALGVPVVAYDGGPLSDLSDVERVPTLDADAWIPPLLRLSADAEARRERAAAQRRAVEQRHSAQRVAAAYEALYEELARQGRRRGGREA